MMDLMSNVHSNGQIKQCSLCYHGAKRFEFNMELESSVRQMKSIRIQQKKNLSFLLSTQVISPVSAHFVFVVICQ